MPTKIAFLDKNLTLDVLDDVDEVRDKLEHETDGRGFVKLVRQAPEGTAVWINPAAVAFIEASPSRTLPGQRQ